MAAQPAASSPAPGPAGAPALQIDRLLPRYDYSVVHAGVFRAPPDACYRAAHGLDLLRHPAAARPQIAPAANLRPPEHARSCDARRRAAAHVPAG
jgi:hypothetical protein